MPFFIFFHDVSIWHETTYENDPVLPIFPYDWKRVTESSSHPYEVDSEKNYESARKFESIDQAITWLKGHIMSNFIYKIAEWKITNAITRYENCPTLLEVEEL